MPPNLGTPRFGVKLEGRTSLVGVELIAPLEPALTPSNLKEPVETCGEVVQLGRHLDVHGAVLAFRRMLPKRRKLSGTPTPLPFGARTRELHDVRVWMRVELPRECQTLRLPRAVRCNVPAWKRRSR